MIKQRLLFKKDIEINKSHATAWTHWVEVRTNRVGEKTRVYKQGEGRV
jgi:hypothetical protein